MPWPNICELQHKHQGVGGSRCSVPGLGNVASRSKELEGKLRHTDCRLPGHLYDLRYKIRNAADKLASSLQRTPTDAEVAEHLNMPIKKVLNIKSVRAVLCKRVHHMQRERCRVACARLLSAPLGAVWVFSLNMAVGSFQQPHACPQTLPLLPPLHGYRFLPGHVIAEHGW